jgi:hypothetical protein
MGFDENGRVSVGWVELIRAFTPVFAGYVNPSTHVAVEIQLVGYDAIAAANCRRVRTAPNPPYGRRFRPIRYLA